MTFKKLIGMAVVLVLLAAAAVWQQKSRAPRRAESVSAETALLDGVDLNAVDRIDVTKESSTASVVKKDGRWVVESLYGYPADFGKLADALRKAAEVKTGEPVRSANVDDSEFGLTDDAKAIAVKVGGADAADITVGARREASSSAGWANQFFIRRGNGDSVYLVDYDFRPFSENASDWINKELVRVSSSDIVAVQTGDAELKEESGKWTLTDLNADTEDFQTSEANRLRSALQYFNCATVADPAKTDADLGFDAAKEFVADTKDGFTYTVKIGGETDDGRYVRVAVAYTRLDAPAKPAGDDADKQSAYEQELKAFNETADANAKKVDELNAKLSGWTYVISGYTAESLMIPRDKLVKAKEKAEEESTKPEPSETI
ncbi:MAG: DUF4340 domain-containing protein [Kiritimatiellales bacterium]